MATDTASCSNAVTAIAASLLGGAAESKRLGKAAVLTMPRVALWPATRLATVINERQVPAEGRGYAKILTARAITSPRIMREPTASTVMANLAHQASGIASVGLNAVASVKPR
jgi:hypothetical protein